MSKMCINQDMRESIRWHRKGYSTLNSCICEVVLAWYKFINQLRKSLGIKTPAQKQYLRAQARRAIMRMRSANSNFMLGFLGEVEAEEQIRRLQGYSQSKIDLSKHIDLDP